MLIFSQWINENWKMIGYRNVGQYDVVYVDVGDQYNLLLDFLWEFVCCYIILIWY